MHSAGWCTDVTLLLLLLLFLFLLEYRKEIVFFFKLKLRCLASNKLIPLPFLSLSRPRRDWTPKGRSPLVLLWRAASGDWFRALCQAGHGLPFHLTSFYGKRHIAVCHQMHYAHKYLREATFRENIIQYTCLLLCLIDDKFVKCKHVL